MINQDIHHVHTRIRSYTHSELCELWMNWVIMKQKQIVFSVIEQKRIDECLLNTLRPGKAQCRGETGCTGTPGWS